VRDSINGSDMCTLTGGTLGPDVNIYIVSQVSAGMSSRVAAFIIANRTISIPPSTYSKRNRLKLLLPDFVFFLFQFHGIRLE
jgi:hypothetical protein